jgi:hypothetical protein
MPTSKARFIKGRAALIGLFLFLQLGLPSTRPAAQTSARVRQEDNSDWWSGLRTVEVEPDATEPQNRELPKSNFQILGVDLDENMFSQAAAKIGKPALVERGDAATGREQACYVSTQGARRIYLIFEQGEVTFGFYLFEDGPAWSGSDACLASRLITKRLATASGLHLGQSPSQVIAILGAPSERRKNELVYSLSVTKKTSPEDLQLERKANPSMNEKDIEENYGSYNLGAGIDARFVDSKLTFLSVWTAETN